MTSRDGEEEGETGSSSRHLPPPPPQQQQQQTPVPAATPAPRAAAPQVSAVADLLIRPRSSHGSLNSPDLPTPRPGSTLADTSAAGGGGGGGVGLPSRSSGAAGSAGAGQGGGGAVPGATGAGAVAVDRDSAAASAVATAGGGSTQTAAHAAGAAGAGAAAAEEEEDNMGRGRGGVRLSSSPPLPPSHSSSRPLRVVNHRRTPSLTSPPPPPSNFNPRPDFTSDTLLHGIETPPQSTSTTACPSTNTSPRTATIVLANSSSSSFQQAVAADDALPSPMAPLPAAASSALAALPGEQLFAQRPQIRAIQRLSSESIQRSATVSASSTGSAGDSSQASHGSSSSPSEGSEILAARRDELMTQLLTSNDSPESSQRASTASSNPTMETVAIHVLNPTPPASSLRLTEDAIGFVGVGGGDYYNEGATPTPHPRPLPSSSRSTSDEAAHAWDSVWPAANAAHRVNLPPEAVNARFPLAPMSPYVTPSFSPAAVESSRRFSSSSPPAFEVPDRPGALSRVVSQGSHTYGAGGPAVSRSDLDPQSPPRSPRPLSSSLTSDNASWTIMSSGLVRNRPTTNSNAQPLPSSSSPGPNRPVPLLASSPPINVPSPAGRRERSLSFINQFPELAPPFISRRELVLSPNRITRRLSETAIQRPDAPRRLEALVAASRPPTEPRPDMSAVLTLSPAAVHRPDGPRRARSAQDAAEGGAQLYHDPNTTSNNDDNIPHLPTIHHLNNIIHRSPSQLPTSSSSLPSSTSAVRPVADNAAVIDVAAAQSELDMFRRARRGSDVSSDRAAGGDELMFDMDECAITDDEPDVDESPTPTQLPVEPTVPLLLGSPLPRSVEWDSSSGIGTDDATTPPIPPGLVDEGDLLPTGNIELHHEIDVTFDDEGLNTLERIFLLSRSEYAFHRAYVARVLGDLLRDVDPCESVEYVLPLISAFSLDEDDSVKEAFAADLHRILWYFYTTCLVVDNTDDNDDNEEEGNSDDAATTAADVIDKGGPGPLPEVTILANHTCPIDVPNSISQPHDQEDRMLNIESGGGTSRDSSQASTHFGTGSSTTGHGIDTPMTSVSFSASSTDDAFLSGGPTKDTHGDDNQLLAGKLWDEEGSFEPVEAEAPELVCAPVLSVDFFRPLLGTMLLSHNSAVANPTRDGIIALVARLRNHGAVTVETWGSTAEELETRQNFMSQTGPHEHDSLPFDDEARLLVEQEILYGIVLGMGALSTDVADHMMDGTVEILRDSDGQEYDLQMQLEQEATLGRALSLSLIGSMSEFYSQEEVTHYGFVDEVIRGLDGDVSTRAEAALAMGNVVKCASIDQVDRMLGVFDQFANDVDSQVRQSVCVAFPALCKRIPDDRHRRDFAVSVMKSFINDVDDVRCAALEVLGEVIYAFSNAPRGPPMTLLEMYVNDKDSSGDDCDWDILASFNFPGVALTLGADRWDELKGLFHRLVDRGGARVLRTVAAFLHELAIILHPEQVAEDVLPVYQRCLDGGDDLRGPVFEHVDLLISNLPLALGWQCFRELQDMWDHDTLGGWRAREQIALHIPSFLETFCAHEEVSAVLALMRSSLLDPFAAVREAATYAVPQSYDILGRSKCSRAKLHDVLLDLSLSSSYRQRLTFVRCLREFIRPPPNREAFERFFVPALSRLDNDIVDVRIGLARAVGDLFIVGAFYGDQAVPVPRAIKNLASLLSEDDCAEVREIILRIGADRWVDVPAGMALREQSLMSENPIALSDAVDEALSCSGASSPVGVHSRADIASPAVQTARPLPPGGESGEGLGLAFGGAGGEAALHGEADEDDVDRVGLVADPFAESFAHAAVLAQGGSAFASRNYTIAEFNESIKRGAAPPPRAPPASAPVSSQQSTPSRSAAALEVEERRRP